jgi:uncharacterized protein DUF6364
MKNITLAIDETLLEQARSLAERRKTSLNALVRALLASEIEQEDRIATARRGMKRLMDESRGTMPSDYRWNRDEIYAEREDRMLSRHEHPDLRGFGEDK